MSLFDWTPWKCLFLFEILVYMFDLVQPFEEVPNKTTLFHLMIYLILTGFSFLLPSDQVMLPNWHIPIGWMDILLLRTMYVESFTYVVHK